MTSTPHPRLPRSALLLLVAGALLVTAPSSNGYYQRPGTTQRVTMGYDGSQTKDPVDAVLGQSIFEIGISANGRYVAFSSTATNLVPGDVNNESDIFR